LKNESSKESLKQLIIHVYFKAFSGLLKQRVAIASFSSLCFCHFIVWRTWWSIFKSDLLWEYGF